jgi:hypothetical protein
MYTRTCTHTCTHTLNTDTHPRARAQPVRDHFRNDADAKAILDLVGARTHICAHTTHLRIHTHVYVHLHARAHTHTYTQTFSHRAMLYSVCARVQMHTRNSVGARAHICAPTLRNALSGTAHFMR